MTASEISVNHSEHDRLVVDLHAAPLRAIPRVQVAIAKTAADLTAEAQRLAKVDTGTMKNSIGYDLLGGGLTAVIGPTVAYAPFVEFGTRRMAPQPFMGPALDRTEPGFMAALAFATGA